jgi:hypothetical protein
MDVSTSKNETNSHLLLHFFKAFLAISFRHSQLPLISLFLLKVGGERKMLKAEMKNEKKKKKKISFLSYSRFFIAQA